MILGAILLGTLTAGIGSVWLAALLSFGVLARYTQHMLSLAAGALLATAFMHLLPEAFESRIEPHLLFTALLVGLVFFFLLDKAELWHHGHEHHHCAEGDGHDHGHDHDHHHHGHAGLDAKTHDTTIGTVSLSGGELDPDRFFPWIQKITQMDGPDILRLKGIVAFKGDPERYVVQGIHMIVEGDHQRPWKDGEKRQSRVVFIGRKLDREKLERTFSACAA